MFYWTSLAAGANRKNSPFFKPKEFCRASMVLLFFFVILESCFCNGYNENGDTIVCYRVGPGNLYKCKPQRPVDVRIHADSFLKFYINGKL